MRRAAQLLPLLFALRTCVSVADEIVVTHDLASSATGGFALLALIVGTFVCMVLLGIGLAIGLAACVVTAVLVSFGVVSSAVAVAFLRRNPASGLRALFLQIGAAAGVPCGIAAVCLISWLARSEWSLLVRIGVGGLAGLTGGMLVALIFNWVWGRMAAWILAKFKRKHPDATVDAANS
jgi:hypothetical protein